MNSVEAKHNVPGQFANWIIRAGVLFFVNLPAGTLFAQEVQTVALSAEEVPGADQHIPADFSELLRMLLLESMKSEYADLRHWKRTVERFDGFHIHGIRISKRERDVPHGFWRRYKVTLIQPEKTFEAQVQQLAPTPEGAIPFSILISLRARCEATFAWWAYGVKGINGTAVSDATIHLRLRLETSPKIHFRLNSPFPQFDLRPRVTHVELKLKDLDVRKLGILKGDLAEVLGDGSRKAVEAMMQQQEGKIRDKLQKSLEQATNSNPKEKQPQ